MCCRKKWAQVLTTTFSVLAAIAGLIVISFCFKLILDVDDILGNSNVSVYEKGSDQSRTTSLTPSNVSPALDAKRTNENLDAINKRVAMIAFSVGISAVMLGLAGICTSKIKRCLCTCTFGFVAMVLTGVYALASFVLLSMYYVTNDQVKDFCNDDLNLGSTEGLMKRMIEEIENYVYTVDNELKYAINRHMCTDFCPCEGGWDYSIYGTEQGLNFADHARNDYNFDGSQTVFTTCYAERNTLWSQQYPEMEAIDEEVVSLMKTLEQDYDCSGMCQSAMFYASKSIKEGPPKQACIYRLKESFDDNMVLLGWSIVATGLMALLMFCCHCGLYLDKDQTLKQSISKKKFIFD